jgi:hypothetical protein
MWGIGHVLPKCPVDHVGKAGSCFTSEGIDQCVNIHPIRFGYRRHTLASAQLGAQMPS